MDKTTGLKVSKLVKTYATPGGKLPVLRAVSFEVQPGETLAITGPSGSGKSTLLNIIGSLDKADSGSIKLNGLEVSDLAGGYLSAYRNSSVGFVFQDHHLLPQLTALENVLLPSFLGAGKDKERRAKELLAHFGLKAREGFFPAWLSGGERQRVAVARALINSPKLLLCDEPTGSLDAAASSKIAALFTSVAGKQKIPVVVVTHNMKLAAGFDTVMKLEDGELKKGKA